MKRQLFPLLVLLFTVSCGQIENESLDPNKVSFKTNDASKLFFKNNRQSYYDLEINEAAKLEVYRWKDKPDQNLPQLNLALVNNWRFDEAYLLIEPNTFIELNTLKLRWKNTEDGSSGAIEFVPGNKENHARFAGLVYQQLRRNSSMEILLNDEWKPFLTDNSSKDAFEKTVYDFFRLTERL